MIEPLESRIAPASLVTITDASGDLVTVEVIGTGSANVTLIGGALDNANIEQIELVGTDLKSKLNVSVAGAGSTNVSRVVTSAPLQHMGYIDLFPGVTVGDGVDDGLPDVRVSGKLNDLFAFFISPYTIFSLGAGLPYDVPGENKTPDTYNNRPNVTFVVVLGEGVELNVIGDGTPQGVGGGGLGDVLISSWSFPGFIRTTQSIDLLKSFGGDFLPTLEVDKFHVGAGTVAGIGMMKINNGAWGSIGSEIEGSVKTFDAGAFLASATLTAASLGKTTIGGDFEGTITLTDPDSPALPSFTVDTDFTGTIISAGAIKKLKVKGDFMGSLQAPLIGAISAYSFIGAVDGLGDPTKFIRTTNGALGTLTSTAGPITDFEIDTNLGVKGIKVSLSKLAVDTIGIDNVKIKAATIGNISVSLKAAATATDLDLIGIRNSTFEATGIGTTKKTAGSIGNVAVAISGAAGGSSAIGIQDSSFSALVGSYAAPTSSINSLGKISVKISGQNGSNLGLDQASFAANNIGGVAVNVSRHAKLMTSTAQAINGATFTATGAIGAVAIGGDVTDTAVDGLQILAGGNVGNISVKTKTAANGTLLNSSILAGQALVLDGASAADQTRKLGSAKLGNVSVSGSITNTDLVAGAMIGGVSVGGSMSDSLVLAGATLGGDFALDGDETYQRAASISGVKVTGAFERTSLIAGVNPSDFIFGNNDDALAAEVNWLTASSSIGKISLPAGSTGTPNGSHDYAIAAGTLAGLKLGGTAITTFPLFLDGGSAGEESTDVIVRTFSSVSPA